MTIRTPGPVVVVGTANLDLTLRTHHLPRSGETVLGDYAHSGGGKAANQAVAACRLGAETHLVTLFGDDENGAKLRALLTGYGVDLSASSTEPGGSTGVALIFVDDNAHTMIGVAEGANRLMRPDLLDRCPGLRSPESTVIVELGIPLPVFERLCELRRTFKFRLILNPAPYAEPLVDWCWELIDVVTPNEIEAGMMTGIDVTDAASALAAAHVLRARGIRQVIVTLGAAGVAFMDDTDSGIIPAYRVDAVDTTAASDAFNGALAFALSSGSPLRTAVLYANAVAALSVTRAGAQASMPTEAEVNSFLLANRTEPTHV